MVHVKHIIGISSRRFVQYGKMICMNCKYAGLFRSIPILYSIDKNTYQIVYSGSNTLNRFIHKVILENDFSKKFPDIVIIQ